MSTVKILVKHRQDGFCNIFLDGELIDSLEDMGDSAGAVADVLKKIFAKLNVNVEVIEK